MPAIRHLHTNASLHSLRLVMLAAFVFVPITAAAQWVDADSLTSLTEINREFSSEGYAPDTTETVWISGTANVRSGLLHETYLQMYVQNDSSGLSVFRYEIDAPVAVGDSVVIKGKKQVYFGQPELLIEEYRVYSEQDSVPEPRDIFNAAATPGDYTGMLVKGTGIIKDKGYRFNGKYLMIAPSDTSSRSVMVYVSNFHTLYQEFDFDTPSVGDKVSVTGVLGQYDPAFPESITYKVFLRTPDDLSYAGWPRYYFRVLAIILMLLIVAGIIWMVLLRRQVKRKTEELQRSLDEKEMLIKEIHHRVKNNLAGISGLLQLQASASASDEVHSALQESQARIASMVMVHERLYQSVSLKHISMKEYLQDLSASIKHTMSSDISNINIELVADEIHMNSDQVIPLGLLVNELLVNAFKHAFNGRADGRIILSLTRADDTIILKVEDDGVGLPQDLDSASSDSLGMLLVNTFAEQLNAYKTVENTPGACFVFKFPAEAGEE